MVRIISVSPIASGWAVSADTFEPAVFASGARAEAAARSLADRVAGAGETAEIRIFLRDGSLAGRFVCAPDMSLAS